MRTETQRLSLQHKPRPSILEVCIPRRETLNSRSPLHPSKGKPLISPMKIKKFYSRQLFAEAHRVNGETFLPETPQSALFPQKGSTLDTPTTAKKSNIFSPHVGSSPQVPMKMQIQRVMSINIQAPVQQEGDLTKLINQGIGGQDDSFGNISTVQTDPSQAQLADKILKQLVMKKNDTISQLLQSMKGEE